MGGRGKHVDDREKRLIILYDSLPEGRWIQGLDQRLSDAELETMSASVVPEEPISRVLEYDRPDIVLLDGDKPILVIERTEEVPSGHNVGQRYARLVAAARHRVPVVYMFPYAAMKHGGETAGPRYANLRLFRALSRMAGIHDSAVVTVNWPVDKDFELLRGPAKDREIGEVVSLVLDAYEVDPKRIHGIVRGSATVEKLSREVDEFSRSVARRTAYDRPPNSVEIGQTAGLLLSRGIQRHDLPPQRETVIYKVGMRYLRSDPYTGMAMLYDYLYARETPTARSRAVVLHFPHIALASWRDAAARGRGAKTVKLFVEVADLILFSDGYLVHSALLGG